MGDKGEKKGGKGTITCRTCGLEVSSTHTRCSRGHDPRKERNGRRKSGGSQHKAEQKYRDQGGR